MPFIVDSKVADTRSRPAFYSLLGLNLRLMENWRRVQTAITGQPLDCDATMIMMAIVVIGGERLLRTGLPPGFQSLESQLPSDLIAQVNLSSIAAATSINRETVRRKIGEFQDAGLVVREKGKVLVAPGVLQRHEIREIITAQINAIASTCRQLTKIGAIVSQSGPAFLASASSRKSSSSTVPSPAQTANGVRGAADSGVTAVTIADEAHRALADSARHGTTSTSEEVLPTVPPGHLRRIPAWYLSDVDEC